MRWSDEERLRRRPALDWDGLRAFTEQAQSDRAWASRIVIVVKMVFFMLRAYQDAMCRILQVVVGGGASKMHDALKNPANPVRELVDAKLSDYKAWFYHWTKLRNQVKQGVSFSFFLEDGELGVRFAAATGAELPGFRQDLGNHGGIFDA